MSAVTREPLLSRRNTLTGGFAVVLSLPTLFGTGKYSIDRIFCNPNWATNEAAKNVYNWVLIVLGFFLPTGLWTFCDLNTFQALRKWNINGNPKNMIRRKKVQIEMLVGIVSFYLVWIPYIICAIIIILGGGVKHEVLIAATFCTKFGVIINPIVFVFRNRDIMRGNLIKQISQKAKAFKLWKKLSLALSHIY